MADNNNESGTSGQSDRKVSLRDVQVYVRTTADEKERLFDMARAGNYPSLSQYMRESGLYGNATPTAGTNLQWEAVSAVNRLANEVKTIADNLSHGRQPDEELLLVAMQIQELAEETLKEIKAGTGVA